MAHTQQLNLTSEQIKEIISKIANKEEGFIQLIQIAFESFMKSEREEHNKMYQDVSNGYRKRLWRFGRYELELQVPRSRNFRFYPKLLLIINDSQQRQLELASLLYSQGLSVRQISEVLKEYFGHHYSLGTIESLVSQTKEQIHLWLQRPLESHYIAVYIDAIFIPVKRVQRVSKEAFLTVLGVREDTKREVLGIYNFVSEISENWSLVFNDLRNRGAKEIDLVVSDALPGIEEAILKHFPKADHQLCTTHLQRNIINRVRIEDKPLIKADLKQVFTTENQQDNQLTGIERFKKFAQKWSKKYRFLTNMIKSERLPLYFTYLNYDVSIRKMIYTTNWIERLNREFKRALRYRSPFPEPKAVINIMALVANNIKRFEYPLTAFKNEKKFFR